MKVMWSGTGAVAGNVERLVSCLLQLWWGRRCVPSRPSTRQTK